MPRRHFSLDEANAAVPELQAIFGRVMQIRGQLKLIYKRLDDAGFAPTEDKFPISVPGASPEVIRDRASFQGLVAMLREEIVQVQELGCEIKDVETGLVDWFAESGGREILLCWKYGEKEVGFWHDLEAGFAGRRPVAELSRQPAGTRPRTLH